MNELTDLVLVYRGKNGTEYEQPLADIQEVGTLIDPDDGDDLELIGWRFATAEGFVLVEGGMVQNNPGLPVFDIDVLTTSPVDPSDVDYAIELRERIADHPEATKSLKREISRLEAFVREHGDDQQISELTLDAEPRKET